jgi:hypothetical protein
MPANVEQAARSVTIVSTMTLDDIGRLFENFARSAFRIEARDRYDVPAERDELAAFRAGKSRHRRAPDVDAWLALVASATASGRTVDRVRLVTRPLTQYTRYEFACHPDNIAAGETIGIVERRWLAPDDQRWAGEDFWIFDDEIVVVLEYDKQGRFLGVAQAERIDANLVAKQRAISRSVDFNRDRR